MDFRDKPGTSLLSALLIATALADPTAASLADPAAEVPRLVKLLDAAQCDDRNRAEQELLQLGPAALEFLPTPDSPSADLNRRLTRIRAALQKSAAEASARPSMVKLNGAMPLADALAALEKQTGNKIVDRREQFGQPRANPQVKADFDSTPFWQALDDLLDQAQLSVYRYPGERGVVALVARPQRELPRRGRAAYCGPLRIEASRITTETRPTMLAQGTLKVALEIAWEPRLAPITIQQPIDKTQALDDRGQRLSADSVEAQFEAPAPDGTAVELLLPFVAPPRAANSLASLEGTLQVLLPGKLETFRFDRLAQAAQPGFQPLERKKAAAAVTLDTVRGNGDLWEVRIRVRLDDDAQVLHTLRNWILQNEAYLVDRDDKRIDHAGFESTTRGENEVGVSYLFELPDGMDGFAFVYKTPSSIQAIPVPYKLNNISLP